MRWLGLRSVCRWGEPQGRRAALGGFWGRLSGGIACRGAGTASRPGVKLLSLVQLVINKSNGQFDFTPCVCLCGTWHAPVLLLPSETVSARVSLEACEVSVEEKKSPGLCHRFETVSEHDLQSVFFTAGVDAPPIASRFSGDRSIRVPGQHLGSWLVSASQKGPPTFW